MWRATKPAVNGALSAENNGQARCVSVLAAKEKYEVACFQQLPHKCIGYTAALAVLAQAANSDFKCFGKLNVKYRKLT